MTPSRKFSAPAPLVWLALAAVYVIWGSTYLGIKYAIGSIPPLLMAGARFLAAGALLLSYARFFKKGEKEPLGLPQWKAAAAVGAFLLLGGNGGVVLAEQYIDTGLTALLVASTPLWMALLGRIFLGETIRARSALGILLGFSGVAALAAPQGGARADLLGAALVLGAAFSWSCGSLYSRKAALPKEALAASGMEMISGGVILLAAAALRGEFARFHLSQVTAVSAWSFLYLILFGAVVGFSCYMWLIRVAPLAFVATYAYVNPVVAVLLGSLFLKEPVGPKTLLAGAVTVVGVALIVTGQEGRPKEEEGGEG